MIIESEHQYQKALDDMSAILGANGGIPPIEGSPQRQKLEDLLAEVKIYENRYYKDGEEIPTFEFHSKNPETGEVGVIKLKENELLPEHITMLVDSFMQQFQSLPAAARRALRIKLRY